VDPCVSHPRAAAAGWCRRPTTCHVAARTIIARAHHFSPIFVEFRQVRCGSVPDLTQFTDSKPRIVSWRLVHADVYSWLNQAPIETNPVWNHCAQTPAEARRRYVGKGRWLRTLQTHRHTPSNASALSTHRNAVTRSRFDCAGARVSAAAGTGCTRRSLSAMWHPKTRANSEGENRPVLRLGQA
jgi:hypothetical protein